MLHIIIDIINEMNSCNEHPLQILSLQLYHILFTLLLYTNEIKNWKLIHTYTKLWTNQIGFVNTWKYIVILLTQYLFPSSSSTSTSLSTSASTSTSTSTSTSVSTSTSSHLYVQWSDYNLSIIYTRTQAMYVWHQLYHMIDITNVNDGDCMCVIVNGINEVIQWIMGNKVNNNNKNYNKKYI
jgi:hypothetical protein